MASKDGMRQPPKQKAVQHDPRPTNHRRSHPDGRYGAEWRQSAMPIARGSLLGLGVLGQATSHRIGAGVGQTVAVVFVAHLYGVALTPAQLATVAVTNRVTARRAGPGGDRGR